MKILTALFLVSFLCWGNPESKEMNIYTTAYDYLNNCKNLKSFDKKLCRCKSSRQFPINVIKEIYPLSIFRFDREIIKGSILKSETATEQEVSKFMLDFDKESDFKPFNYPEFENVFAKNKESQIYVAFSKPIGDLLFAELAYNFGNNSVSSIRDITRFNKSLSILFIFDQAGNIKEVKTNINQYD